MKPGFRSLSLSMAASLPLMLVLSEALPAFAQPKAPLLSQAESAADEDANSMVEATVWLNLHNKQELDETVKNLYKEGSPNYHHWLKPADLSRHLPAAAELRTVRDELSAQGLKVTAVGKQNLYLKVSGNVSAMQSAFHTQIKRVSVQGHAQRATTSEPKLSGASQGLVASVSGLSQHRMIPMSVRPIDPDTGKAIPPIALSSAPNGVFFASDCFRAPQGQTFTTPGAALPIATYAGNRFGSDVSNTALGTLAPCGYGALNMSTAYGLQDAFKAGLDGTGQTIVIVDAYGSPTIKDDANTFSQLNGLPALTDANFQVINPLGPAQPTTPDNLAGWQAETSIDVEWAHAMAPGANIVLLIAPSNFDNDLDTTLFYAIDNQLGSVISNSYSGDEADDQATYPQELLIGNTLSELGAALGISVDFSSGDYGDFAALVGVPTVSDLGASPYATSVGGTSLAIDKNNKLLFEEGWGNNFTKLASSTAPLDPPLNEGFVGGAGGGESVYFAKPSWQSSLPGTGRQQPDVALDADPYTGAEIVVTVGGQQVVETYGGTSLACPMFSAFWAIANQRAGQIHGKGALLGQAAPIIAKLGGTDAMTDTTPYSTPTNVAGIVFDSNGPTFYSPDSLVAPLQGNTQYLSALYNSPFSGSWFTISFGTDTSLVVGPGWDNVTGFGSPKGLAFINAAAQ